MQPRRNAPHQRLVAVDTACWLRDLLCMRERRRRVRGMDVVLNQSTGLTVKIADDPLTCVARGTAIYLESLEAWKSTLESDADEY